MKRITYFLIAAALLLGTVPATAQTIATSTTLAANATATDTTLTVTSATGYVVGAFLYIDAEQLLIRSVNGTAIGVQRGVNGTAARAHDNAERVLLLLTASHFNTNDPDYGADCTRGSGQAAFLPFINVRSGTIFACQTASGTTGSTGSWSATNTSPITFNSIPTSF